MQSHLENLLQAFGSERRINYSLDRFQSALGDLQNPERNVYSLIVSGTNGKGSTTLFLSSALNEAGLRVCTFLSPHLQCVNERFLLNMMPADENDLSVLASAIESTAKKFSLSYFEFLTLLFFVWAKSQKADWLVLEVGLGGRLDATNVTTPRANALTNVAFDHQMYLGDTLAEILYEKLGTLPAENGSLFTSIDEPALVGQVETTCSKKQAKVFFTSRLPYKRSNIGFEGQTLESSGMKVRITNPTPGAAKNALLALTLLRETFPSPSPISSEENLKRAFTNVVNPGRMEMISSNPRVLLSGDHNPAGLECLIESLKELGVDHPRIVCAFSPDKPYEAMIARLKEIAGTLELTQVSRFQNLLKKDYRSLAHFEPDPIQAVEKEIKKLEPEQTLVVTGSLYLIGEVRKLWRSNVRFLKTHSTEHR